MSILSTVNLIKSTLNKFIFISFLLIYTVAIQFYQLWTIFIVVNHHVFPAIHCLLTGKSQELYESLLVKIQSLIPHFHPDVSMSDWEMAARNAFKSTFHGIRLKGCWFHYTQRIWKHVQKANLKHSYNNNVEIQNFVRYIMALPFLPPDTILQIFNQIDTLDLNLQDDELMNKVKKIKLYVKRQWIDRLPPEELSIWDQEMTTNNGAESYHGRLKSLIKCNKPRIWNFLAILNNIITDTDNEIARLQRGLSITRGQKKKSILNQERRLKCKENLSKGCILPFNLSKRLVVLLVHSLIHG